MHKIGNKPMLQMVLENAHNLTDDITIVYSNAIEPYLADIQSLGIEYKTVLQPQPLGTGDAVRCALKAIDESKSVIVLYADNPFITSDTIKSMINDFQVTGSQIMVMGFEREKPDGYGRIVLDDSQNVQKIVECKETNKKESEITLCNSGIILFEGRIIGGLIKDLMENYKSSSGEYYLTSLLEIAYKLGYKTSCYKASSSVSLGVNTLEELVNAQEPMVH